MPGQRYKVVVLWGEGEKDRNGRNSLVILILASSGSEKVLWRKRDYL